MMVVFVWRGCLNWTPVVFWPKRRVIALISTVGKPFTDLVRFREVPFSRHTPLRIQQIQRNDVVGDNRRIGPLQVLRLPGFAPEIPRE